MCNNVPIGTRFGQFDGHSCCGPHSYYSLRAQVFDIKEEIEDKQLEYPEYYTRAFHGAHAVLRCAALRSASF